MAKCPECGRECSHLENGIHIYNDEPKCCICQKTNNAFIICFDCNPKIDWVHFRTTGEFKLKETSQIEYTTNGTDSFPLFSANQWRSGENLRGETFHLWLKELSEKHTLHIGAIKIQYEIAKEYHFKKNNLTQETMKAKDYLEITKIVEIHLNDYSQELIEIRKRRKRIRVRKQLKTIPTKLFEAILFLIGVFCGIIVLLTVLYFLYWFIGSNMGLK